MYVNIYRDFLFHLKFIYNEKSGNTENPHETSFVESDARKDKKNAGRKIKFVEFLFLYIHIIITIITFQISRSRNPRETKQVFKQKRMQSDSSNLELPSILNRYPSRFAVCVCGLF